MPEVVVYSTPSCPYCVMVKQFLSENKVGFTEYDVANDYARAEEMVAKSGQQGVPVIDIKGKIIVGFDRQEIRKTLGLK